MPLKDYLAGLANNGIVIPEEVVTRLTEEYDADLGVETAKYTSAEAKITELTDAHTEAEAKLLRTQAHNYELSQQVAKSSSSGNKGTDAGDPPPPEPIEIFH